jgi:hypothetical protein
MEPERTTTQVDATRASSSASSAAWMRGLFMLIFLLAFAVAQSLLWVIAIVQFCWLLFAGEHNAPLAQFGRSLAAWLAEVVRYITCATEIKPFPWAPWPSAG